MKTEGAGTPGSNSDRRTRPLAIFRRTQIFFPVATWFRELLSTGVQQFVLNSLAIRRPSPPTRVTGFLPDGIESALGRRPPAPDRRRKVSRLDCPPADGAPRSYRHRCCRAPGRQALLHGLRVRGRAESPFLAGIRWHASTNGADPAGISRRASGNLYD